MKNAMKRMPSSFQAHTGDTHITLFTYMGEETLFTQEKEKDKDIIQRERE